MTSDRYTLVSRRKLAALLGMPWSELRRIASVAGRHYEPFDRDRVRGQGKWRHIDNPTGILKELQTRILRRILATIPLPPTMCGGVKGRSTKDHAGFHVGQAVVVTMDLKSCFPRTPHHAIYGVYTEVVGCAPEIAALLTQLTTFQGRVPQGAPTSPTLVNLSLLGLHDELADIARSLDLEMSFFVDDIAFSGARATEAIEPAIRSINRHGHAISRHKLHVMRSSERQDVTGQVVNAALAVSRNRRAQLHDRIHELAAQAHPLDRDLQSLRGAIANVRWINPAQGATLERLAKRLLPDAGIEGPKRRTDAIRPCTHRRRHRTRLHRALAGTIARSPNTFTR